MNIDQILQQAQDAYQSQDFERATRLYEQVLHSDNSHEEALFMRAMIAQAEEDWDSAAEFMHRTLNVSSGNATHHFTYGQIQMRRGDFDRAYAGLSKAVELDPNYLAAHASLGYAELRRRNWAAAEKQLRLALKVEQDNPQLLVYLGMALMEQGNTEKAINYLEHAVKLAPKQGLPHYHLGRAMLANGQAAFAIQCFDNALDKLPKIAAEVLLQRGQAEEATGQLDKAAETYHQSLQQAGRSPGAVAALARLYRLAAHPEAAEQVLRDHPVPAGQFEGVEQEWAEVLLAQGRPDAAIEKLQTLAESPDRDRRVLLARAYYLKEELDAALDALAPEQEDGLEHTITQSLHARILHAQNKPAAAEKILDGLLEQSPRPVDAVLLRAERLMRTAQAEDARALLNKSLDRGDLHPAQRRALLRTLGDSHYLAGEVEAAQRAWSQQTAVPSLLARLDAEPVPEWTYEDPEFSESAESAMSSDAVAQWPELQQPARSQAPVLVYGWPGTGRRRLLRMLSAHVGLQVVQDSFARQLPRRQLVTSPRGAVALGQIDQQALRQTHRYYRQLLLSSSPPWGDEQRVVDAMPMSATGLPAVSRYFPDTPVIVIDFDPVTLALAWQRLGVEITAKLEARIEQEHQQLKQCQQALPLNWVDLAPGVLMDDPEEALNTICLALDVPASEAATQVQRQLPPPVIRTKR